ncbi:Phosphoenolpyruvate carboxykinase [ATP] [hydrothermal vent metagenome]|uniref:phosphoenolpyruvate carboxykinase (ATP) n=1 Tax=hydrothermal vent metagenome TaxID=652676 RepID=A0A3B1E837_9ZZZZ
MSNIDLSAHGITVTQILRNPSPARLYEEAVLYEEKMAISNTGALISYSGEKTGRSPKDKRVVKHVDSQEDVWWGPVNIPLEETSYSAVKKTAVDFLNSCERLYCIDAYAGWDHKYSIKVRVISARPYHALFMNRMLIRPTPEQLADFGEPEYVIYNAGQAKADPNIPGLTSDTTTSLSIEEKEIIIIGSEYAGEMKKGIFTVMNYLMPKRGVLSMHCSATSDKETEVSSVLFGLSGTGKTTLSADPKRHLIGDDEHCWTDHGIFNIEGGCYAKAINLSEENEPDIYAALKFGAVLENVVYDEETREVDYTNVSITQNTRGAYPIEYIENANIPCVADHPSNVIFLTCDAFGVLPPVSKLSPEHAMYHFISGYTAKVAGTEVGVTEPEATFSPCFGGPFLVWHPGKYAELLAERIQNHNAHVWLVNTGWSGGAYGTGSRMKLKYTRSIIDAIHSGKLENAETTTDPYFGFEIVTVCPGVPSKIMVPKNTWKDADAFEATAKNLANLFRENFKTYEDGVSKAVIAAGPQV